MNRSIEELQYESTMVIKPPENKIKDLNIQYLYIDSRDRNYNLEPNSNNYTYYLNESIRNITEIELQSINLPKNLFNITSNNNRLYYTTNIKHSIINDNNILTIPDDRISYIEITPGNYDIDSLKLKLKQELEKNFCVSNANDPNPNNNDIFENKTTNVTFTVNYDINKNKFDIQHDLIPDKDTDNMILFLNNNATEIYDNSNRIQPKMLDKSLNDLVGMNRNFNSFLSYDVKPTGVQKGNVEIQLVDLSNSDKLKIKEELKYVADNGIMYVIYIKDNLIMDTRPVNYNKSESELTIPAAGSNDTLEDKSLDSNKITIIDANNLIDYDITIYDTVKIILPFISNSGVNLNGETNIFLHIKEFETIHADKTGAQDAFSKINIRDNEFVGGKLKQFSNISDVDLSRINKLNISFKDANNNLVDFNNMEHNLTLALSYYKQSEHYNY